nr:FRG domain-containing protein [Rhizobium paranaense]
MSRGRMFEYTPTDIEKRLEGVGSTAIDFLEKLPTFLCSEISKDLGFVSMLIKYGHIGQTQADRKEVSTRFKVVIDFGEVKFDSVEEAKELFGADGFQLYRTHWAVRSGDFRDILRKIAQAYPEFHGAIEQQLTPDETTVVAEPPVREKNIIGVADSVEIFLGLLHGLPVNTSMENFYRGHEDASFELTPSLLRKWPDGAWKYMPNEDRLCKELLIAHYDEFQGDQYCFDRLVRMQHYGLPTRLLDISGNPLMALFFACYCREDLMNSDGEVIIFRIEREKIKYYDSDTVSCLSNLSNLTNSQKSEINLGMELIQFNNEDVAHKLLHHIKSEKSYFEGRIQPDDLGSILCVKAKRTNSRIKSQSGAFLLFGHEAILPEVGTDGIEIARIGITNKKHILAQLDSININATTVYPSIDQTTVHLRDRYLQPQST